MKGKTLMISLLCLFTAMAIVNVRVVYARTFVRISPEETSYNPGDLFSVTVNIDDVANLYGWGVRMKWDARVLKITSITEGPFLKSGGLTYFTKSIDNNLGDAAWGCTLLGVYPGVTGSGAVSTVNFKVLEAGGTGLDLYDTGLYDNNGDPISHVPADGSFFTGMSANLVAKSAWPEHHHYVIGKDEDAYQNLTGKVMVSGPQSLYVKVVFSTVRDDGKIYKNETSEMLLAPGIKQDITLEFGPLLAGADTGKYYVTVRCEYSYYGTAVGDTMPDWKGFIWGTKIKTFSFAVV